MKTWSPMMQNLGIWKILGHDIRMKKNTQSKEEIFWIFKNFHGIMRIQSPTCTPARKLCQGVTNPEIVYTLLRFQILCIDWTLTLTENLLNFNGTYTGPKQPFQSFLKNGRAEWLVSWESLIFYQFKFYLH